MNRLNRFPTRVVARLVTVAVLSTAAVAAALVGFRTPGEVDDLLDAPDLQLDAADLEQIDAIMQDAAGQTTEVPA